MPTVDPGPGFQTGDVGVPATVSTFGTTFPSTRGSDILGTAKNVNDLTARDAIAANKRDEGMTAWVISTGELYRLVGGILNANWILEASAGGGNALVRTFGVGVLVNDVVYQTGVAATVGRADASAVATGQVLGVVRALNSPAAGQCIVVPVGADLTGFVGLVIGARYILASTPGGIVAETDTGNPNYPAYLTPGSGEVLAPVGVAGATTSLAVNTGAGIVAVG